MKIDQKDIWDILNFIFQISLNFWNIHFAFKISNPWLLFIYLIFCLGLLFFWVRQAHIELRYLWFKVKPGDVFKIKDDGAVWNYNTFKIIENKILILSKIKSNNSKDRSCFCYFIGGYVSIQHKDKSWFKNFEKIG